MGTPVQLTQRFDDPLCTIAGGLSEVVVCVTRVGRVFLFAYRPIVATRDHKHITRERRCEAMKEFICNVSTQTVCKSLLWKFHTIKLRLTLSSYL